MIGSTSFCGKAGVPEGKTYRVRCAVWSAVCAFVIGVFAWSANSGALELWGLRAEDTYYNLLVQGFRAGQLSLKKEVPPGLAQLADPYDPAANGPYRWPDRNAARHELLQGQALPLLWGHARLGVFLAVSWR